MDLDIDFNRVIKEIPEYAAELMKKHEKEIVEIQKDQLLSGYRGDGKRTKKYLSKSYMRLKSSSKSLPYADYKLTGAFQNEIFLQDKEEVVYIGSMDEKSAKLEGKEDNKLFGITPENQGIISNLISKELIERTGNELGKD
jgi:hypothetical protein